VVVHVRFAEGKGTGIGWPRWTDCPVSLDLAQRTYYLRFQTKRFGTLPLMPNRSLYPRSPSKLLFSLSPRAKHKHPDHLDPTPVSDCGV